MPWCRRRYGALKKGWKGNRDGNGFVIRRRGVILEELAPVGLLAHEHEKSASLSAVLDAGNDKWGKNTLILASEGFKQSFTAKAEMRSPRYTTRLADLPIVRA